MLFDHVLHFAVLTFCILHLRAYLAVLLTNIPDCSSLIKEWSGWVFWYAA